MTAATVLHGADELRAAEGRHLGHSEWLPIDQDRVDRFAEATGDHQSLDYLTLSLSNHFLPQIVEVTGFAMGVNYGTGRVRFIEPVEVGRRIRAGAVLTSVTEVTGGLQTTMTVTIEMQGADQPACVIESISRWLLG